MKRVALSIAFCVLSASAAFAQTKSPIEGVWKISEVVTPSSNTAQKDATTTNSNPQPGLIIFTRGYYSQVFVRGGEPRAAVAAAKDPQNLTDAEKVARYEQWGPFTANSGTYEVKGTMLTIRAIVAKSVEVMTGGTPQELTFKLEGPNTLWLIPPADQSATRPQVKLKLTRLE
jgi:Lipocalin-like domain